MTYTGVSFAWCIFDNAHPPIEGVLPLKNSFPPSPSPFLMIFKIMLLVNLSAASVCNEHLHSFHFKKEEQKIYFEHILKHFSVFFFVFFCSYARILF